MTRWEPHARERLERAALEVFTEKGFSSTSVPEIAARAGLTNRTFFRHFGDKREVLFAGERDFSIRVSQIILSAPPSGTLMQVLSHGLETAASTFFEGQRDFLRARRAIILSDESLKEREMGKQASLAHAMRAGFLELGFEDGVSTLAAEVAASTFSVALARWLDQCSQRTFVDFVHEALEMLVEMTGGVAL